MLRWAISCSVVAVLSTNTATQSAPIPSFVAPEWRAREPFPSIYSVLPLHRGPMLVSDQHDQLIRLLDASGNTVGSVGRVGGGPGEFQSPGMLVPRPGDSV